MAYSRMCCKGFLYVTLLCGILSVTSAEDDDKLVINLQKSAVLNLRQQAVKCEKETGVPADTLKKLIDWPLPSDVESKKFINCVLYNGEYINKEGHFDVKNILDSVLSMVKGTKDDFENVLTECNEATLENNIETTYAMCACLHEKCVFTFKK